MSRPWCLLAVILIACLPLPVAADDKAPFDVYLTVRDGYLAVDPARTTVNLTGFAADTFYRACRWTPATLEAELVARLDRLLRNRGTVLEQKVSAAARARLDDLIAADSGTAGIARLTKPWVEANDEVRKWAEAHQGDRDLVPSGVSGLDRIFEALFKKETLADGPIIAPATLDEAEVAKNFRLGRVPFDLAAPMTADYRKIRPEKNVEEWAKLRQSLAEQILRPLECRLWSRGTIVGRIADYLEMRGISVDETYRHLKSEPTDRVGVDAEQPYFDGQRVARTRVLLSPDPLLAGVLVQTSPDDATAIRRALYLTLPSDDYGKVAGNLSGYLCLTDPLVKDEPKIVHLRLREGPGADLRFARTYLTRRFLAERLRYLEAGGFTASPVLPDEDRPKRRKFIHLLIAPKGTPAPRREPVSGEPARLALPDCSGTKRSENADAAPPLEYDRGKDAVRPETFTGEKSRRDTPARRPGYEPERPHNLRLGVEHVATKPLRYVLGYTHVGLFGGDALSAQAGFQDEPSGDVQYSRDFVGFGTLGRRLQLSLRGFSDFTPDRRLSGGDTNERRTGGEARGSLDVWRDRDGHWAQWNAGASGREIKTDPDGGPVKRTRLTLVDTGLLYFRSWEGTPSAARLEVEPIVTWGESDDRAGWFVKPSIEAHHHQFAGAFVQWDARGRALTTAGATPEVERPSFGGESSVRGYRPDAGLARTVWAVQNELWFPVRIDLGLPEKFEKLATFVRRNVAAAVFADVGGLHESTDRFSGVKAGAGLGVRLVYQDYLTLRLDWAHAVGDRHRTRDAGLLYFTVTTARNLY